MNDDEQRKLDRKIAAQEKVAKTFTPSESKKRKLKSVPVKSKNGGMVELMKIKSQAKGSPSIPTTSRIYLYVQCPKDSKLEFQSVYFDKVCLENLTCMQVFISSRKILWVKHLI